MPEIKEQMQEDINELKSNYDFLNKKINGINEANAGLIEQMSVVIRNMGYLNERLKGLENHVATLEAKIREPKTT